MRAPRKPKCLRPGDRVALLSPASPPETPQVLAQGLRSLEALGLRAVPGRNALSRRGYLAGDDRERARDLTAAFLDPGVKAIFATRGGYGASRLLEHFDPAAAAEHPKILVGFSDLTTLHLALQAAGLVSFWGPMPCTFGGLGPASARIARRALMSAEPLGLLPNLRGQTQTLRSGRAEGRITGGTLTLLAASLGTPYAVRTRGCIVFLEDIGEEPYKIDRLLTQLLAAGRLRDAAGIVIGGLTHSRPKVFAPRHSLRLQEVLADRLIPLQIPVYRGLAVGHFRVQAVIPYGVLARLDAGARTLEVMEPALRA